MTTYAAHQPDLLPYPGFWHKLDRADIFELKIFDQFQDKPGYQRRVKMRDAWVGQTCRSNSSYAPIYDYRIDPTEGPDKLAKGINRAYGASQHWNEYGPQLIDFIMAQRTPVLWEFNVALLIYVRDLLGITTPFTIGVRHEAGKSEGIVETMDAYNIPGMRYLSGRGGQAYMDEQVFADAGYPVEYTNHKHVTGDSILTVLMDYDDPMAVVRATNDEGEA